MIFPDLPDLMRGCESGADAMRHFWIPRKDGVPRADDCTPHGFDSRDARYYVPGLSLAFPRLLKPGESLCSSISFDEPFRKTYGHEIHLVSDGDALLRTAAVLTCLNRAPPADAFRPPYAGSHKPIFTTSQLKWDRLPRLPVPWLKNSQGRETGAPPDWAVMERLLERPCIDRVLGGINENCNTYGREFARVHGLATLMLMLDVPQRQKEKVMLGVVQRGIDYYGLMKSGQVWIPDGGINLGRKWVILFAGLMLGEKSFHDLSPWSLWQEDTDTYYGAAWDGRPAASVADDLAHRPDQRAAIRGTARRKTRQA